MKGQSSTNILALQFLQTHKYLEKKIITPKISKINFYNLISTLFKKLYYNQEIPRFHNKLQSSLKLSIFLKKMFLITSNYIFFTYLETKITFPHAKI